MKKYVSKQQFKIDAKRDLVAYIDEAGDEGWSEKSSRWFLVGAVVIPYEEFVKARGNLDLFQTEIGREWKNIHFRKLKHNQRRNMCAHLAKSEYKAVFSAFSKFDLTPGEKDMFTYPSMYFIGIKNVIERVSWLTKQDGMRKVHIMIGNRNNVKATVLSDYLYGASVRAERNLTYFDRLGNVVVGNESEYGIKMADCIASSMHNLLEPKGVANVGDRSYYDISIADRIYNSAHSTYGGIWNNGFRCTPRDKDLVSGLVDGILTED